MTKEKENEIKKRVDDIIVDLLVPVRATKTIDEVAYNQFYEILDELVLLVKDDEYISRSLIGVLFDIYSTLYAEAYHSKYPDPLFMALAEVESYMSKILPVKNGI